MFNYLPSCKIIFPPFFWRLLGVRGPVIDNMYLNTVVIRIYCLISNECYVYVCYVTQSFIDCFHIQYDATLYNSNDFNLLKLNDEMESSFCCVKIGANKHCRFYQIAWATWGDKISIDFILNLFDKTTSLCNADKFASALPILQRMGNSVIKSPLN